MHLEKETGGALHELLVNREFDAPGKIVSEIAAMPGVIDKTISTYRARILDKMGLKTNAEITRYAVANGLVDRPAIGAWPFGRVRNPPTRMYGSRGRTFQLRLMAGRDKFL